MSLPRTAPGLCKCGSPVHSKAAGRCFSCENERKGTTFPPSGVDGKAFEEGVDAQFGGTTSPALKNFLTRRE